MKRSIVLTIILTLLALSAALPIPPAGADGNTAPVAAADSFTVDEGGTLEQTGEFGDETKFTASDGASGDWFGNSVSVSGDWAVVGAPSDADGGNNSGSAYIFQNSGGTWSQAQKITAADAAAEDAFGFSVSISGSWAVIGASGDDSQKGAAYIFQNNGGTWSQAQKITASDGAGNDSFGYSVSVSGDWAVIGASGDDSDKGAAYIFRNSGGTWSQEKKLTAADGAGNEYFGWSVSVAGAPVRHRRLRP